MQKTLKRLFVLLLSAAIMACIAVFAACDKGDKEGEESEEGKITITVCFPDGTPVNGHTDGDKWYEGINGEDDDGTCITLQFCKEGADGECSNFTPLVGEDGKVKLDIQQDIIGNFSAVSDTEEIEVHVLGVTTTKGYLKGDGGLYGKFKKNEFPSTLTITLQPTVAA